MHTTFTIVVSYSEEMMTAFAGANGWTEESAQDSKDFSTEIIKRHVSNMLIEPTLQQIRKEHQEAMNQEIDEEKEIIDNLVTISYTDIV